MSMIRKLIGLDDIRNRNAKFFSLTSAICIFYKLSVLVWVNALSGYQ